MNQAVTDINIQSLALKERIAYYEQEINLLSHPKTFREKVLVNVYRCLLQGCLRQNDSVMRFRG